MEIPFLIEHKTFQDERGNFCSVRTNVIEDSRLDKNWVQVNNGGPGLLCMIKCEQ